MEQKGNLDLTQPCQNGVFGRPGGKCSWDRDISLQTASEVKFSLRFEVSDLNYLLHIHVHIAYMV